MTAAAPIWRLRRGRHLPWQPWHRGLGVRGRYYAVRPYDDGQCRVVDERLQGGASLRAGETDAGPSGPRVRAGLSQVPASGGPLTRTRSRWCRAQKSARAASGSREVSTVARPARIVSSRTGGPSPVDTSGLGIRQPTLSVARERDGRRRRRECRRAPSLSCGVAVTAMACRMRALRTAAASAICRTAAARSWPPVIAQPTVTALRTMARACGRRSAS